MDKLLYILGELFITLAVIGAIAVFVYSVLRAIHVL